MFQGRFKANLVDADSYLLELVRYIHLNPYRAEIPGDPEDYHWSSHRFYVGEDVLPWLTTELVLEQFSGDRGAAREGFRRFVAEGKGEDEEDIEFHPDRSDGRLIGDDQFMVRVQEAEDGMKATRLTLDGIIEGVSTAYGIGREELMAPGRERRASEARSLIGLIVQEQPEITLTQAATVIRRDSSTLSAGLVDYEARCIGMKHFVIGATTHRRQFKSPLAVLNRIHTDS